MKPSPETGRTTAPWRLFDPRLFSVVFGLWTYHLTRGEHRDARYFAEESQKLADQLGDTNLMLRASWALGCSQHCMGEMTDAHDTHDRAIRSHNSESHAGLFVSGQDPLMSCLHFEAVTLWILGRLNQSRERGREADRLARKLGHPFTLQWYLTLDAMFCQIRRDYSSADARIAEAMPICEEYGFEDSLTMLRGLQMMSLVGQGKIDVSLAVAPSEAAKVPEGRDLFQSWARGALAEALVRQGNPSFALAVLDQAFELVDRVEERFFEAELHRIRGEAAILLDIENGDNDGRREPTRGERSLRQAFAIAHDRKAQMFKLRAATSLSRLQIKMDQHSAARETLLDAYNSFTGGFECADLTEARDLLRTFD